MNHDCNGDWVPSIEMYRCFLDGMMVDTKTKPTVCPNCRRPVVATTHRRPKLRSLTMKQVRLKICGDSSYFTYEIGGKPLKTPLRGMPSDVTK